MVPFHVTVSFPIHWGEMDVMGHVNHARYFTWFESARIALFAKIGIQAEKPRDVGPILAMASCDFIRPVVFPASIVAGARILKVGRTSITMEYAVWRADEPERPCARGASVAVLVDYRTMEKVEVPGEVRTAIAALSTSTMR
ncbi:MAG TPA: thioesterase family protein [Polyangiaceae bacterium]|jgi:acyl-CoA thioester hydrolase|nr:thioesterase family protein [Polyangiaceae bacterium]